MEQGIFSILYIIKIPSIIACMVAITIKEYTKALISSKLGDPMPKRDGRVTLNPFKHIEIVGFILMVIYGCGWSKPVETTPLYYEDRRKDSLITYIAPLISNIIAGIIFGNLLNLFNYEILFSKTYKFLFYTIGQIAIMNVQFAIFSLIPIAPLEGANIIRLFISPNASMNLIGKEKFYLILLVLLIFIFPIGNMFNTISKFILNIFII